MLHRNWYEESFGMPNEFESIKEANKNKTLISSRVAMTEPKIQQLSSYELIIPPRVHHPVFPFRSTLSSMI